MKSNSTAILIKIKLRHSLGRPSRSDFVQSGLCAQTRASTIRDYFAKQSGADFTEPITAGIFVSIVAWASYQRAEDKTPYWRTLKANGELNAKYPGGIEAQKEMLENEGHTVVQKGRTNIKYYVKDYEKALFTL